MRMTLVFALAVFCLAAVTAQAAAPVGANAPLPYVKSVTMAYDDTTWWKQPDLLGFSVGWYDALKNNPRKQAVDFRLEHRWGTSLLPMAAPETFAGWDKYFQIRPMAGIEGTSDGALYGYGGFMFDIFLGENFFLSPSEVVGIYYRGNGKRLGSFVEFRSTMEAGYRFDNNMRISASFGHISNAGLTSLNPGVEILSANIYIPTSWVFGK